MNATFTIEGRLPGMNEIIAKARYSRFSGAEQKRVETARCVWAALSQKVPPFVTPVTVNFRWIESSGRRDIDNVAGGSKFILDGLVMAGILRNDTREWVKGLTHEFPEPNKNNPRIEVTITEV